jgi:hypothetical protein
MKNKTRLLALSACLLATSAYAGSTSNKMIEKTYEVDSFKAVDVDVHVGSIKIKPSPDDQIHLQIKIEPKDGFFNWFSESVDKIKLKDNSSKHALELELTEGDYEEKWILQLPKNLNIELDIGVGDVNIKGISSNINVDNGVGHVKVVGNSKYFADIDLDAGVGDTRISADHGNTSNKRAVVSSSTTWQGSGEFSINIDVGVGNAEVFLDD